jgi:hypothetical protein
MAYDPELKEVTPGLQPKEITYIHGKNGADKISFVLDGRQYRTVLTAENTELIREIVAIRIAAIWEAEWREQWESPPDET